MKRDNLLRLQLRNFGIIALFSLTSIAAASANPDSYCDATYKFDPASSNITTGPTVTFDNGPANYGRWVLELSLSDVQKCFSGKTVENGKKYQLAARLPDDLRPGFSSHALPYSYDAEKIGFIKLSASADTMMGFDVTSLNASIISDWLIVDGLESGVINVGPGDHAIKFVIEVIPNHGIKNVTQASPSMSDSNSKPLTSAAGSVNSNDLATASAGSAQ